MSPASRVVQVSSTERSQPRDTDGAGVIAPPPLLYLAGLAAGFALQAALPATALPASVAWSVGSVLILVGTALARSFFRALHRAETPISPYSPTTTLVTTGVYRLTRNPGYLGMTLSYAGIAIVTQSLWVLVPLALILPIIDRGVIAREERYLDRRFDDEYRRYRQQTRRWL